MNCPVCCKDSLTTRKLAGCIEVDVCSTCSGVWFDEGEIGDYARFAKDIPEFKKLVKEAEKNGKMCPRCPNNEMVEMKYSSSSDLMIDYCEDCQGVWLDGGEVTQLLGISGELDDMKLRLSRAVWEMRKKLGNEGSLVCPGCNTDSMHAFTTSENVTVDLCDSCRGIWFDKGELARTVEMETDLPFLKMLGSNAKPSERKCPHCTVMLIEVPFAPNIDMKIDFCKKCGGVYLDSKELATIEDVASRMESKHVRIGRALTQLKNEGYVMLQDAL